MKLNLLLALFALLLCLAQAMTVQHEGTNLPLKCVKAEQITCFAICTKENYNNCS
jgi:hypothetical protein